jgi:predicted TIM-barrel fold metal-dependent hydrolase
MLVDAQVHIWGAESPDRPWPAVHGVPHRVEPYGAAEIIGEMDRAGVERAVIVPPSWEGDRNDLAVAAVLGYPGRFGIMGRIDLTKEAETDLDHWRDIPGMLGVRLTFHRPEMRSWLTDGSADWLWRAAERAELPIMMLAPGQSGAIGLIARSHPELQIIVDHLNLPGESKSMDIGPTIDSLAPLIDCTNVAFKISALPCYTDETYPFPNLGRHIRRVIDTFGPERCMWGSDISRLPGKYAEWVAMFDPTTGVLTPAEADQVGGETALRVLRWAE